MSAPDISRLPTESIDNISDLPFVPAVYILHQAGSVLYVGKTNSLKRRIQSHEVVKKLRAGGEAVNISWVAVKNEEELDLLELQYAHAFQPPLNRAVARYDGKIYWWAMPPGFREECSRRATAMQEKRKQAAKAKGDE